LICVLIKQELDEIEKDDEDSSLYGDEDSSETAKNVVKDGGEKAEKANTKKFMVS